MADPTNKSLPTGVLEDILDEERAAKERDKALGPEFQKAAEDLRRDMQLRASQRLFDWQHLADEGDVGVADPEELKRRIEARFGPPSESQGREAESEAEGAAPGAPRRSADSAPSAGKHDTIEDVNPLAGEWKAEERRDSGPINVGGQTRIVGVAPPVGAVTLPASSPNDVTQLIPRKRDERRRLVMLIAIGAIGIPIIAAAALMAGNGSTDGGRSGELPDAGASSVSVPVAPAPSGAPYPTTPATAHLGPTPSSDASSEPVASAQPSAKPPPDRPRTASARASSQDTPPPVPPATSAPSSTAPKNDIIFDVDKKKQKK